MGTTQTVASVTLPVGQYTLSADVSFSDAGAGANGTGLACKFVSAGMVHQMQTEVSPGAFAVGGSLMMPIVGDVTVSVDNTSVFVRCSPAGDPAAVVASLIATRVQTLTPSL
ncbi:MAG TPA: hypothetical protein VGF70_13605 [Solirubrobacteraceae bacterium]